MKKIMFKILMLVLVICTLSACTERLVYTDTDITPSTILFSREASDTVITIKTETNWTLQVNDLNSHLHTDKVSGEKGTHDIVISVDENFLFTNVNSGFTLLSGNKANFIKVTQKKTIQPNVKGANFGFATGESKKVNISCQWGWKLISPLPSWIHSSFPKSGSGGEKIDYTIRSTQTNPSQWPRIDTLTFSLDSAYFDAAIIKVPVKQKGNPNGTL